MSMNMLETIGYVTVLFFSVFIGAAGLVYTLLLVVELLSDETPKSTHPHIEPRCKHCRLFRGTYEQQQSRIRTCPCCGTDRTPLQHTDGPQPSSPPPGK